MQAHYKTKEKNKQCILAHLPFYFADPQQANEHLINAWQKSFKGHWLLTDNNQSGTYTVIYIGVASTIARYFVIHRLVTQLSDNQYTLTAASNNKKQGLLFESLQDLLMFFYNNFGSGVKNPAVPLQSDTEHDLQLLKEIQLRSKIASNIPIEIYNGVLLARKQDNLQFLIRLLNPLLNYLYTPQTTDDQWQAFYSAIERSAEIVVCLRLPKSPTAYQAYQYQATLNNKQHRVVAAIHSMGEHVKNQLVEKIDEIIERMEDSSIFILNDVLHFTFKSIQDPLLNELVNALQKANTNNPENRARTVVHNIMQYILNTPWTIKRLFYTDKNKVILDKHSQKIVPRSIKKQWDHIVAVEKGQGNYINTLEKIKYIGEAAAKETPILRNKNITQLYYKFFQNEEKFSAQFITKQLR